MRPVLLLLVLAGCAPSLAAVTATRTPPASVVEARTASGIAATQPTAPVATQEAADDAVWSGALGAPALPAPGAIAVAGYAVPLTKCLPDPADHAGFTASTDEFGYCAHGMAWTCELVGRSGEHRVASSAASDDSPEESPTKARALGAWMKAELPALKEHDCALTPPRLEGTWAYSDITVRVVVTSASPEGDGAPSLVRIGGSVAGAAPVFPVTLAAPSGHRAELNALALSEDGKELGWVMHTYGGEWSDQFRVERVPAPHLAALVYNDTGYAAYRAGDLARAAELFRRAAYVDATAELPAYNLACTYARTGDSRAEPALDLALARGGEKVRRRALKDADFDGVRATPWFHRMVGDSSP